MIETVWTCDVHQSGDQAQLRLVSARCQVPPYLRRMMHHTTDKRHETPSLCREKLLTGRHVTKIKLQMRTQ